MGYIFEAEIWTFMNTNITHHRLTKIEGEDSLSIGLLEGNEQKHKEIIKNAVIDETEFGFVCIPNRLLSVPIASAATIHLIFSPNTI